MTIKNSFIRPHLDYVDIIYGQPIMLGFQMLNQIHSIQRSTSYYSSY